VVAISNEVLAGVPVGIAQLAQGRATILSPRLPSARVRCPGRIPCGLALLIGSAKFCYCSRQRNVTLSQGILEHFVGIVAGRGTKLAAPASGRSM